MAPLTRSNERAGYPPAGVLSHPNGDGRLASPVYECPVCGVLTRRPDLHRERTGHEAATTDAPSSTSFSTSGPGAAGSLPS